MKKTIAKRVLFVAAIVTAIIPVCLLAWDYADPPMMWHKEAQENKRVILEYAEKHFPEAKIIKQVYESSKLNFSANPHDYILFEQDGVRFSIWANDGELWGENYLSAKGSQYIKREIIEKFLKPRNIKATYSVHFEGPDPIGPISEYNDRISIHIAPEIGLFENNPRDSEWLYEFYTYINGHSELNNSLLYIVYSTDKYTNYSATIISSNSLISEDEFYNSFKL